MSHFFLPLEMFLSLPSGSVGSNRISSLPLTMITVNMGTGDIQGQQLDKNYRFERPGQLPHISDFFRGRNLKMLEKRCLPINTS